MNNSVRRADAVALPAPGGWAYTRPEPPENPADSIWLNRVAALLRRRKFVIASASIMGLLVAIAATLEQVPAYRARTALQLEGFSETFLRDTTPISPLLANATAESYVRNQVNVLQSDTLALRVAERLGIEAPDLPASSTLWSRVMQGVRLRSEKLPTKDQQRIALVRAAMKTRMVPASQIIEVQYEAPDPDLAAKGANTIANEFIALSRETRWQVAQDTTEWLSKQTADIKRNLEEAGRRLQEYARSHAGGQQTLEHERTRQLQEELIRAEGDRALKQSRYETALLHATESLPDLLAAAQLRQYESELQVLQRQLADLRSIYTTAHSKVVRVQAQIAVLQAAIDKEKRSSVERLKTEFEAAARLENIIAAAAARQLNQFQAQIEREARYNILKREFESTQQLYDATLHKTREAAAAAALRATNIRVVDSARPPSAPQSPNVPMNLSLGLALGLLGGLALALFYERPGFVKRPGEAMALNLPELGVIPSAKHDPGLARTWRGLIPTRPSDPEVALEPLNSDTSLLGESFRATLTSILFSLAIEDRCAPRSSSGSVIVVSSAKAQEGKTTVLANLAVGLARTNRRVLVIDADLRKPRMHTLFNVAGDWGLANLVRTPDRIESSSLHDLARPTGIQNLWLLPSGQDREAVTRVLYSADLNLLFRRFRAEFDVILVDTPPLMFFSDARILGRLSDGLVLVIRANRARMEAIRTTCRRLAQDGIPMLGTILNDWRIEGKQLRTYCQQYRRYARAATH